MLYYIMPIDSTYMNNLHNMNSVTKSFLLTKMDTTTQNYIRDHPETEDDWIQKNFGFDFEHNKVIYDAWGGRNYTLPSQVTYNTSPPVTTTTTTTTVNTTTTPTISPIIIIGGIGVILLVVLATRK